LLVFSVVELKVLLTSRAGIKVHSWGQLLSLAPAAGELDKCRPLGWSTERFVGRLIQVPFAFESVEYPMQVNPVEKRMEIGPFLTLDLEHERT